jgi:dihydrofolate synthase/folylpolyglutamate synthase
MEYSEAVSEMREDISDPDEFGFEEYREQVRELGDPQGDVKTIHVAGTNGKGSTCNIIYEILREAGYSTGLFTGPHLGELVERIEVDGKLIERAELGNLYEEIRNENFSMFESLVIIAFKHYIEEEVDVAVIETGCGGERDATNIVNPEASIITNVGLDHSHVLGETVEEIAEEKAGIIKEGKPSVTNTEEPALKVIERKASEKDSELTKPDSHVQKAGERPLKLSYRDEKFASGLKADYQLENINAAIEAIERSGLEVSDEDVVKSLKDINVPGRMEKISEKPEIFLDGAHNHEGMEALISSIERFDTVVFGCMRKKPYSEMIELLEPHAENFVFTRPEKKHAWEPEKEDLPGEIVEEPVEAVEAAEGRTLVTGSLYLAGMIRQEFQGLKLSVCP